MMKLRHTYWHAKTNQQEDIQWLNDAVESMQKNTWTSPFYVDGTRWDETRQESAIKLFQCLGDNSSVSSFIFKNATMNRAVSEAFEQAMEKNKAIRSVSLRNLKAIPAGSSYDIPSAVFSNPFIESLNFTKVSLDEKGCLGLCNMILTSKSLKSLTLDATQIEKEGFGDVLAALAVSSSITTLKLANLDWSEEDIQSFLVAAECNENISSLSLEGCRLGPTHAQQVAKLLQKNKTITHLSLRNAGLDATALNVLVSQGLLRNFSLQTLFLSRNNLGDEGSVHICELLKNSSTLLELCLVNSKIGKSGCLAIVQSLQCNGGLRTMHLDGNSLDGCSGAMVESLQRNVTLHQILDQLPTRLSRHVKDSNWILVDFYLRANRANRRWLLDDTIHCQLLPLILSSVSMARPTAPVQTDVLFYFVQNMSGTLLLNKSNNV